MKKEKCIYGLAMPFNDCYSDYNEKKRVWEIENTNKESVLFDRLVGCTVSHDYSKEIARTDDNSLSLVVDERGVFFKIIPSTPFAMEIYERVESEEFNHCSLSYLIEDRKRNIDEEKSLKQIVPNDKIEIYDYKKIVIYEVCLTNQPNNKNTFCTTDINDPRLEGIDFDTNNKLRIIVEQTVSDRTWRKVENIKDNLEKLQKDIQQFKGVMTS